MTAAFIVGSQVYVRAWVESFTGEGRALLAPNSTSRSSWMSDLAGLLPADYVDGVLANHKMMGELHVEATRETIRDIASKNPDGTMAALAKANELMRAQFKAIERELRAQANKLAIIPDFPDEEKKITNEVVVDLRRVADLLRGGS